MLGRSYVRGVQAGLINCGKLTYPNDKIASEVADRLADQFGEFPLYKEGQELPVDERITAKIASMLLKVDPEFKKVGHITSPRPIINSMEQLQKMASDHAVDLMKKAEGSTIEGGDKGNDESTTAEGKMDDKNRPSGYAENSQGKTDVDTKPGVVGKEDAHPKGPSNSPSGSNSVEDQSRTASVLELLMKAAGGSNMEGGDKGNQEYTTAEGKMDEKNRPSGYAVLPSQGNPGAIPQMVSGAAVVGKETPHPNGPANTPGGTNSVIDQSKAASELDPEYVTLLKKTAEAVVKFLPSDMSPSDKLAQVKYLATLSNQKKAEHLHQLKTASAKKEPTLDDLLKNIK